MKRLRVLRRWFARKFGYARLVCLALLIGVAALRIADPAPVEELRVRTFDTFQLVQPRVKTARPVTIVDIDEKSLADPRLGQWPWPRTRIADIVNNLTRMGAVVIAFDVVFAEPDRLNPDMAAENFRGLDEATREKLRALPSNDQIFADAIRASRVVLGESGGRDVHSDLDKALPVTGFAMLGEDPEPYIFKFDGLLRNVKVLEEAAAGRGLFTIVPERDGIVRRVPMIMDAQDVRMPALSFEVLRILGGSGTIMIKTDKAGIDSVVLQGLRLKIPTDSFARLWVHYARNDPSIYVSAVDVLDGRVPPEMISRKLILIGTSATGMNDIKTTPVSRAMPGVEIHAQALESALTGSALSQPNYSKEWEFLAALVAGIVVIAFAPAFGPVTLVVVGALLAALLVGTSWYFFTQHRLLIGRASCRERVSCCV
jgi:adenylate cyclase